MRKGLSLIELIFTIVIIAVVFTVIPKIVLSLNKADSFTIRQDAMFNGVSMIKMISKLPWDQNNTDSSDILHVNSSANSYFDCNTTTFRRDGGFIGGRTCEDNQSASIINSNAYEYVSYLEDDIGDFNNKGVEANLTTTQKLYDLNITVSYIDDTNFNPTNLIDINQSSDVNSYTTNLKRIRIKVFYTGNRGESRQLTQFNYTSANIGQMILHKRVW
ncbi:MAG TPA: prepilin-type N-terminal cleavage/methylation domain-containing protein [Sulfurimonas sp.]|nr:prepilin-type N-terminal cleavage/methylation domain-containing protein [Sulfurimonas sp.]